MISHHVRPDGLPPPNGYSQVTVASGLVVHVSGQVPVQADGEIVHGGAEAQADQVFRNLSRALQAAGASWADVVKLTFYLRDMADLSDVRMVRDRFLDPTRLPASTLVQVAGLVHPDFRLEIDAVAVIGD
ncbi:RidA family protein [Aeromicrobium sp.]|uniref:RidA family protein n=1 Tax=Aeromicrobium sp. TaxID=1871063 RepID=UPI003C43FC0A